MTINKQQFWRGIIILLNNYHAINRNLFACEITEVVQICSDHHKENIEKDIFISSLQKIANDGNCKNQIEGFVVHFKCIPKKTGSSSNAMGVLDFKNEKFRMSFENDAIIDFEIQLLNNDINIVVANESQLDLKKADNIRWLEFVLKPKFLKWCQNKEQKYISSNEKQSLHLIDNEKYNRLYNKLKKKYSECAIKLWNEAKESTDPLKFIYEDLAIASYLITLWQSNFVKQPPTAFADLGCGNGLLVYVLIQEGFRGYGYDVRRRKLWSLYPINVSMYLYEEAIEPNNFNFPSDVDWLIGNHSDELSPWLPVLAVICRENVNYFLLPCCAFEFSGRKYQRRNSSISTYKDFCDYAEKISNICGFKTIKDRLKIPSTKRIALIGLNYINTMHGRSDTIKNIKEFIRNEQLQQSNCSPEEIKLREKTEAVRNCTQIEKSVIEKLVEKIFHLLLRKKSNEESSWQRGGRLLLSEIAEALDKDDLKHIKSECGGLKTLLRNKHEIFEFQKPDYVLIRKPQIKTNNSNKPQTVKKRICFFKHNHPQGCPLADSECTFIH